MSITTVANLEKILLRHNVQEKIHNVTNALEYSNSNCLSKLPHGKTPSRKQKETHAISVLIFININFVHLNGRV